MARCMLVDVPPGDLVHVYDDIREWLQSAADASRCYTFDDLITSIRTRQAQLWLAWGDKGPDAVCVTRLFETSKGKHCNIWIMVGHDRDDWVDLMDELETWAKREGCVMMLHEGRIGWQKTLKNRGYRLPHVTFEKDI